MKVTIKEPGNYSKFDVGGAVGAQELKAGDVVALPDWYANSLVQSKLAEPFVDNPGMEVVFQQDLQSEDALMTQLDKQLAKGKKGRGMPVVVSAADPDASKKLRGKGG